MLAPSFHDGALGAVEKALERAELAVSLLDRLPLITREVGLPGVYIHYGHPSFAGLQPGLAVIAE